YTYHFLHYTYYLVSIFNVPSPPESYTLSLHDALPIWDDLMRPGHQPAGPRAPRGSRRAARRGRRHRRAACAAPRSRWRAPPRGRSEEHTSELQSRENLVCRLLLEKKKQ